MTDTNRPDEAPALDPDRLVDRYGERIFRLARRVTGNDADAEDVTQNTLLKVLRKADTFRGESDPMGWIYRIALNESRELLRRRKRKPAVSLDSLPIDFDDSNHPQGVTDFTQRPDYNVMREEMDDRVTAAIDELPDGYREAIVLHDIEGVPYQESARLLDLTLGGFKARLHRARLHLRRRLEEYWATRPTEQSS